MVNRIRKNTDIPMVFMTLRMLCIAMVLRSYVQK